MIHAVKMWVPSGLDAAAEIKWELFRCRYAGAPHPKEAAIDFLVRAGIKFEVGGDS